MAAKNKEEEVLAQIYGAALAPGRWECALGLVAADLGAGSGFFFSAHSQTDRDAVSHVHNHAPQMPADFFSHWHTEDVWEHSARRLGIVPGQVVLGSQLMPTAQLRRTGYFQDFLRPHGVESMVGCVVFGGQETDRMPFTHLCWYRPPGQDDFGDGHRRRLRRLVPHFQRALRLQRRLSWFSDAPQSGALEAMYVACIELDRQGAILRHNEAARGLLQSLPPGALRFGALRSLGERCTPPMAEALAACTPSRPMRILGYLPGPAPQVLSASLVSLAGERANDAGGARFLLLVELPREQGRRVAQSVAPLFGLSAAEARVLGELLEGRAPAAIAQACGTAMPTVRTQISSILAKTGARGQTELLLLLRSLRF